MEARTAPQPPAARPSEGLRVLIVDDNRDFAENVAELIEDLGHRAEVALAGKEAVDSFARAPADIAVIDLQLPDMTGTRVIARLKEIAPECVCIVFTGNATLGNAIEALNRGAFAYLVKGGEVDEFRAVLAKAVGFHRTEAELRKLRGINKAILENFPGRVAVLDGDGGILLSNQCPLPWRNGVAGAPAETRIEDLFPPGEVWSRPLLEHFQRHRVASAPSVLRRVEVPGPQGTPLSLNVHFVPLVHGPARWLLFVDDVTAVVRMEAEIARSARMAALGELSAMIAHEVRNPLSGISGAIQILRARFAPGKAEREVCDQVLGQVDRLDKTIEDLLVLARPMTPRLAETSLGDLIDSTVAFLREDPSFRDVVIRRATSGAEGRCRLDPFLFRQALLNILLNAAQAMQGKGAITLSVVSEPGTLEVVVTDEGPGFPEDTSTLFEPFFTTKPAGTGLGLPITARILEVHGGSVTLRNSEGGGAEVILAVPRTERAP